MYAPYDSGGALDEIVLEEINKTLYYARTKVNEFAAFISQKSSSQIRKDINLKSAELAQAQNRVQELEALFKRLYEDNVLERLSDEQFRTLSAEYMEEQSQLESQIPELENKIERMKESTTDVSRFLELAQKYTDITELTPEILRTFISKIVIHERAKKHDKNALQQIDIYFRYIGNLAMTGEKGDTEDDTESTIVA